MQNNNKTKIVLKIVGILLLIGGLTLTIVGLTNFFSSIGNGDRPTLFWCAFLGLPMFGVGLGFTAFAFKREISRYVINETAPVLNEASEQLKPAFHNVASAFKNGVICSCGEVNKPGSKFCSVCGKALTVACPNCGKEIENEDTYCNHCGSKL